MSGATFTVGVPTHYRPDYLDELLDSLRAGTRLPERVIVAGAHDDEETAEIAANWREPFADVNTEVTYVRRHPDANVQQTKNRILETVDTDVVCYLDDDTVVTEEWLASLEGIVARRDGVGCLGGPAIRSTDDLEPTDEPIESDERLNRVNEYGDVVDLSGRWVPSEPVRVDVCRGANTAFDVGALESIGGFDPNYPGLSTFEDWDAVARIAETGAEVWYVPDALVYHLEATEGGTRAASERLGPGAYWFAHNSVRFRRKHADVSTVRSLVKLLVSGSETLPSVLARAARALTGDTSQLPWLHGYVDGVYNEFGPRRSGRSRPPLLAYGHNSDNNRVQVNEYE